MQPWQLQEAKARFSELITCAVSKGPQSVTVNGKPTVVVISKDDYDRLTRPKLGFVDFLRQSPLMGIKLNIKRDKN